MSFRRTACTGATALALLLTNPALARADKDASVAIYKQAKKKYNLGEFEEAIALFKQAYGEFEAPAYLYNIAQAYRQLKNCEKSLFFYERFLAEKPGSDQELTIKGYIDELKAECGGEAAAPDVLTEVDDPIKKKPAAVVSEPKERSSAAAGTSTGGQNNPEGPDVRKPSVPTGPRGPLVVLDVEAGIAAFQLGDVEVPISPSLRLGAAYPVKTGILRVDAGVSVILSNMAYEEAMGDSSVLFSSYLVNARASYKLGEALRVGGELGLGLFRFASVLAGNPFSNAGAEQEAATTVALRLGTTVEYTLSSAMDLSVSPGFTYAGAHADLASDITSVTNLQVLGGLRYHF